MRSRSRAIVAPRPMTAVDPASLPVLMALRVKGRAAAPAVATAAALPEDAARVLLEAACARGAARYTPDSDAVTLTARGRAELAALLDAEPIDRALVAALYRRFLSVDPILKQRISACQLATEGASATADLHRAATDAAAVAAELGAAARRFAPYAGRLDRARTAIDRADARFVASPFVDSLHQVWFELHEDLLATLGLSRSA